MDDKDIELRELKMALSNLKDQYEQAQSKVQIDAMLRAINSLTSQSDQHLISPFIIILKSNIKVMKIKEMCTK